MTRDTTLDAPARPAWRYFVGTEHGEPLTPLITSEREAEDLLWWLQPDYPSAEVFEIRKRIDPPPRRLALVRAEPGG